MKQVKILNPLSEEGMINYRHQFLNAQVENCLNEANSNSEDTSEIAGKLSTILLYYVKHNEPFNYEKRLKLESAAFRIVETRSEIEVGLFCMLISEDFQTITSVYREREYTNMYIFKIAASIRNRMDAGARCSLCIKLNKILNSRNIDIRFWIPEAL